MSTHWEEIWNYKTDRFSVVCEIAPEDFPPEDSFDGKEFKELIEDIHNGKCEWFMVRCRVLMDHKSEIGADYLGGCAYYNISDFLKEKGYFKDMVSLAIQDARAYLKKYPLPYQRAA